MLKKPKFLSSAGLSEVNSKIVSFFKKIFSAPDKNKKSTAKRNLTLRIKRRLEVSVGHIFFKNPTLACGIILAPVIAVASTFKSGAALAIAVIIMCVPAIIVTGIVTHYVPSWVCTIIGISVSVGMSFFANDVISTLSPDIFDTLGIYFPLIMLSSFSTVFSLRYRRQKRFFIWPICDAICAAAGFSAAAILVGLSREILAYGSVAGVPLGISFKISGAAAPFFGFILVGFFAAFIQWVKNTVLYFKNVHRRKSAETREGGAHL